MKSYIMEVVETRAEKILSKNKFRILLVLCKLTAKEAFTLAEVMITLAVIGILAAMTIPALVNYINDQELKTAWRKEYAIVAQVVQKMMGDNGGTYKGLNPVLCGDDAEGVSKAQSFASNFNVERQNYNGNIFCGNLGNTLRFLYNASSSTTLIKKPDGSYENFGGWSGAGFEFSDGSFLIYAGGSAKCNWGSPAAHKTLGGFCNEIDVDTNGAKGPNAWGKDFFRIMVSEKGAYPYGVNQATLDLNTCDSANYYNCGAWILANPDFKLPY